MKTRTIKQRPRVMTTAREQTGAITGDGPIRLADTQTLRDLNSKSIRKGYNRNLADEFFAQADPRGTHVLSVLMVHGHARMRPVPPHYRCLVLAKFRGRTTPVAVIFDIPIRSFDSLTDARERIGQVFAGLGRHRRGAAS